MTTGAWIILVLFFILVFGGTRMFLYFQKEKNNTVTDGLLRLLFLDVFWKIFKWFFNTGTLLIDKLTKKKDARNN